MITWSNYYYERQRYEDLRWEAEQYRLIRQAFPKRAKGTGIYRRTLFWLGRQLTTLGYHLMEQQGVTVDANPPCQARSVG